MEYVSLNKNISLSRIAHGHWRLAEWALKDQALLTFVNELLDLGVTTFDHADIYGDYTCEAIFGSALKLDIGIRSRMQIITKCGIKLVSKNRPEHTSHHYDYSFDHIIKSVDNSLFNFHTDYIDILLLHRPAPYFDPEEVARAFDVLHSEGKVLHFGVSNFLPSQVDMLQSYTSHNLVTNQIELSPLCLEHFENGNMDHLLKNRLSPMVWSPMAGGRMARPESVREHRVVNILKQVADEHGLDQIDSIAYAWILQHPVKSVPIVGSGSMDRIKRAVAALEIELSLDQWYRIYTASTGVALP